MMQERLDMFTEEAKNGYPVKDIASYRKYTGKKMPRVLVVADAPAQIGGVLLFKAAGIERIVARAHVAAQHAAGGQRPAQR